MRLLSPPNRCVATRLRAKLLPMGTAATAVRADALAAAVAACKSRLLEQFQTLLVPVQISINAPMRDMQDILRLGAIPEVCDTAWDSQALPCGRHLHHAWRALIHDHAQVRSAASRLAYVGCAAATEAICKHSMLHDSIEDDCYPVPGQSLTIAHACQRLPNLSCL